MVWLLRGLWPGALEPAQVAVPLGIEPELMKLMARKQEGWEMKRSAARLLPNS